MLPILTFHSLDDSGSPISISPRWFDAIMDALAERGDRAIDLADWIAQGRPSLRQRFAIAFDDGLRTVARAVETLTRHRFPATVFLVADRMGRDNAFPDEPAPIGRSQAIRQPVMDWAEAREMAETGLIRFGSHGMTHRALDRLDDPTIADELTRSRSMIEDRIGRPCPLFAYPYGRRSPRVQALAASRYEASFGTRLAIATAADPLAHLSRIDAYYLRSQRGLVALLGSQGRLRLELAARRALRTAGRWTRLSLA